MEQEEPKELVGRIVDDEVLRARIRKIADEPAPPSKWKAFSTSPLTGIVLGFVLTGILGASLTYWYNTKQADLIYQRAEEDRKTDHFREDLKRQSDREYNELQKARDAENNRLQKERDAVLAAQQQELAREQSFYDAVNKRAVEKIAEVWESVYAFQRDNQVLVAKSLELLDEVGNNVPSDDDDQLVKRILDDRIKAKEKEIAAMDEVDKKLRNQMEDVLERNRFWMGEDVYAEIQKYDKASVEVAIALVRRAVRFDQHEADLEIKALRAKTERLRQSLQQISAKMLLTSGRPHR
jgi:hypothetical protein